VREYGGFCVHELRTVSFSLLTATPEAASIGVKQETLSYMEGVFPIVFHNICLNPKI
jgi:hypothetical protein